MFIVKKILSLSSIPLISYLYAFQTKVESISLASKSVANFGIFVHVSASPTEKFAAQELKKYLNQMSKADFIITEKFNGKSIRVRTADKLPIIASGLVFPSLQGEEYGIFKRRQDLYLVGGSDMVVLHVIYNFLTCLGCQWILPDYDFFEGKSMNVPLQTEFSYNFISDVVERPVFKYRKLCIEEGKSHNIENLLQLIDWMPKARFNVLTFPIDYQGSGRVKWDDWREELTSELKKRSIIIEVGEHGYQNFLNARMEGGKLFEKHLEWFGMDNNGKRSSNLHAVFCTSNNDAVEYLNNNLLSYLMSHSEIDISDFWPPDSERWCECSNCVSLGCPNERHAMLVNMTVQFLLRRYTKIKLECLAYSRYTKPPDQVLLDKNVLLDFCPINQSFEYQIFNESRNIAEEHPEIVERLMPLWEKGNTGLFN